MKIRRVFAIIAGMVVVFAIGWVALVIRFLVIPECNWKNGDWFAHDAAVYCSRHGVLPADIDVLCDEIAAETSRPEKVVANFRSYVKANLDMQRVSTWKEVVDGAAYVKAKPNASSDAAFIALTTNERLRVYLATWEYEKEHGTQGTMSYRN